jgi:hypothetical protein
MRKTMAVAALVALLFFPPNLSRAWTVDSPPATSLVEASDIQFLNRIDEAIIISIIRKYYTPQIQGGLFCRLPPWGEGNSPDNKANHITAYLSYSISILYSLANYSYFSVQYPSIMSELLKCSGINSTNIQIRIDTIRQAIHTRLREDIRRTSDVGSDFPTSDGDFDMALLGLAHLMYLFQHDPVSLPTDIIYKILCMGNECEGPVGIPPTWAGWGGFLTFDISWLSNPDVPAGYPPNFFTAYDAGRPQTETENHVLSIYLWNYIATNFVIRSRPTRTRTR